MELRPAGEDGRNGLGNRGSIRLLRDQLHATRLQPYRARVQPLKACRTSGPTTAPLRC
jgi:hypothetical protein